MSEFSKPLLTEEAPEPPLVEQKRATQADAGDDPGCVGQD